LAARSSQFHTFILPKWSSLHLGFCVAQSDRQGGFPLEGRVEPQDLTATIYHCLGFSPETMIHDRVGRPFAISNGHPISAILWLTERQVEARLGLYC